MAETGIVILSQAFSQTVCLFARLRRQRSGVKLHPANRSARLCCSCNRTPGEGGGGVIPTSDHHCSCWKRFLRLVPTWDLFILCRLFIKHIINQSGQTTFMITDVNLFLIIDMSYFFLWFAYCVYISSTQTMGAKECILLPLPTLPPPHMAQVHQSCIWHLDIYKCGVTFLFAVALLGRAIVTSLTRVWLGFEKLPTVSVLKK